MGELPVEHTAQAIARDHQVAHPEVPMDDRSPRGRRALGFQGAEGELKRGVWLAEAIVPLAQERERIIDRRRDPAMRGDAMDRRERAGEIVDQLSGGRDILARQDCLRVGGAG
jgi:hypothetical protein